MTDEADQGVGASEAEDHAGEVVPSAQAGSEDDARTFTTAGITPIPEGTRFRLDPTLNIPSLNLPPIDRMLAQAAQTYGIVVRDKGGDVALLGQDPRSMSTNLWPQEFPNTYPSVVLAQFPWSRLQVLRMEMSCAVS